jgi:LmbE family N-acetylglucosaminyl deacetylase
MKPAYDFLMIVAHPDDDALFGGPIQKSFPHHHWAVVCVTHNRDNFRGRELIHWQRSLGTHTDDIFLLDFPDDPEDFRRDKSSFTPEQVADAVAALNITATTYVSHNAIGEYGHIHHRTVHQAVCLLKPKHWIMFGHYLENPAMQFTVPDYVDDAAKAFQSQADIVRHYHDQIDACHVGVYQPFSS